MGGAGDTDRGVRSLPEGDVTFFFTDIEGSTRLLHRHGGEYPGLLAAHRRLVRSALANNRGVEVKTEGDAFFAVFVDAHDAVAASLAAQQALAGFRWPERGGVRVRIGMHSGLGELHDGDYVGLAVHQAARVAAAAHGGQVLLSEATARLASARLPDGAALRSLGQFSLKDFDEPVTLLQLCHPAIPREFRPPRATPAGAHNIVRRRTSFVGREDEVAALQEQLDRVSMLTLVGAGGVGKTRLAQELALSVASAFADGIYQVEMASVVDDAGVWAEVARVTGAGVEEGGRVQDVVSRALAEKSILLLLDGCEHVLDAVAEVADAVLTNCHAVVLLATSRERVGVEGEAIWPVAPLGVPRASVVLEQVRSSAAAQLLCDRAVGVAPGFELNAENADAIASICRHLDGLPLALELAAGQLGTLPAHDLVAKLDKRFETIVGGLRTALPRQQTLEGMIEWSYDLLTEAGRTALRTMAAFAGPFDEAAAVTVFGNAWGSASPPLAELVAKSLLACEDGTYSMLESIREYARDRMRGERQSDRVYGAHLRWIDQSSDQLANEREAEYYARLEANYPEMRAALDWAMKRRRGQELVSICLKAGMFLCELHFLDAIGWTEAALRIATDAKPDSKAWLSVRLAFMLAGRQGARSAEALPLAEQAARLFEVADDRVGLCEALVTQSAIRALAGDYGGAVATGERAIASAQSLGLRDAAHRAYANMAYAAVATARYDDARRLYGKLVDESDNEYLRASGCIGIAEAAIGEGATAEALEQLSVAIQLVRHLGATTITREALALVACVWQQRGQQIDSARLFGALELTAAEIARYPLAVASAHALSTSGRVKEAFEEGRAMSLDEAITFALGHDLVA
jgi:predicted ATPase/class 3 adenylate cyclase